MCGVTEMAIAGIVMSVVGAGVSAYGQYESGQSQKKAAEYNAKTAENAALDAQSRAANEAAIKQQETQQFIARQRASAAANGGVVDAGSNLDLFTSTAARGSLDAERIRNNAGRQATGLEAQADLTRIQGDSSARAGMFGAASSILGGAATAANTYTTYKQNSKLLKTV